MRTGTVFAVAGFGLLLLAAILAGAFFPPRFFTTDAPSSLTLSSADLSWNADRSLYRIQLEGSGLTEQAHIALVYELSATEGILASLPTFGVARKLDVQETYGFLANHQRGFQVLDLRDPLKPAFTGHLLLEKTALDVAVANDYAFVATSGGLAVINVKDPRQPREIGFWKSSVAWSVELYGNQAFVALGDAGISVLDISDPVSPQLVQHLPTRGFCWELLVDSGELYSAEGAGGLRILRASPGGTWAELAHYVPGRPADIRAVEVRGDLIGLLDNDQQSLQLLRRRPDGALEPQAEVQFGSFTNQVKFQDNRALVACGREGLQVVDISDPVRPARIGAINPGGWAWDLARLDDLVLLASGPEGLQIIDPSWAVPLQVLDYDKSKKVLECFRHGDQMIVGDGRGSRIVANATGGIIAELGDFQGTAFAVRGNILLAGEKKSFTLLDIADPENTRVLSRGSLPGTAEAVHLFAEFAALAVDRVGVLVFDISDYAAPEFVTLLPLPDLREACFDSTYCFVASGREGLQIVDLREPSTPVLVGGVPFTWPEKGLMQALSVETDGRHVFLGVVGGAEGTGVLVIDAGQPENPRSLRRIPTRGMPGDLHWSDGRLYVAENRAGLQILDVRRPESPRLLARQKVPGALTMVTVGGGRLWLGINAMGIVSVPEPVVIFPLPTKNGAIAEIPPPAFSGRYSVQVFTESESALLADPIFFPATPPPVRP